MAGFALSKGDWHTLLQQVNILLRSSQFEEAQPKELSVRGKWLRCLGSAGAIGRVCVIHATCVLAKFGILSLE